MKRMMLLAVSIFLTATIFAQNDSKSTTGNEEMKTLFSSNQKVKLGWFVSFEPSYTQVDGHDAYLGGFSGGMVINHNFSVGLVGRGWYSGYEYPGFSDSLKANLTGGYGGLLLEYTLFPKSLVHLTFPVVIGGGGAAYVESWDSYDWDQDSHHDMKVWDRDAYFVFEPGVRAELNILKWLRLNAGVSYRMVSGLDLAPQPSNKLSGFTGTVGFKFGKF